MTYRTYRIAGTTVDVFDSSLAAELYAKRHQGEKITVLVRHKSLFMRRDHVEMTVNLRREIPDGAEPVLTAAKQVAEQVEQFIAQEKQVA